MIDKATGAKLANVQVAATSPTGAYRGKTNDQGYFAFSGVTPDTYTVSFELPGYESFALTGVTVNADDTADASTKLSKSLTVVGRVTATSSSANAFQPKQTQDTYTVTSKQIDTLLGRADAVSETNLLTRLPGASLDRYGYPVLRGGRENEEGFQFDGIPETDAFTSQFTNSLALGGNVQSLQLTPGAGDVTSGGSGTGAINLIAKRGTYPAFGDVQFTTQLQPYEHQLNFEYGFATPNGRISNYFSFAGLDEAEQYGEYGTAIGALSTGDFYGPQLEHQREITDNFVLKFGKNLGQSLQILYDNQTFNFTGTYGGGTPQTCSTAFTTSCGIYFPTADPYTVNEYLKPYTGLSASQLQNTSIVGLLPYQASLSDSLAAENRGAYNYYQPNNVIKFQYNNNLTDRAFFTAKFYEVDAVTTFDFANEENAGPFSSFWLLQGGHRDGATMDFTLQASDKHLFQIGGEYDFLKPTYDFVDPLDGLYYTGALGSNIEIGDFLPNNTPASSCPTNVIFGEFGIPNPGGASLCGYLQNQGLANPGPVPGANEVAVINAQQYAFYLRDKFTPNDRTVIDYGVRVEGENVHFPGLDGCNPTVTQIANGTAPDTCQYAPTGYTAQTSGGNTYQVPFVTLTSQQKNPIEFEPRLAISEQIGKNDAVRASYAVSTEFAPLAFEDVTNPLGNYSKYFNIPSYSVFTGGNAMTCGVTGNLACQNYGDQLHWEFQNNAFGVPIQPVAPETFNNYEFSYSHAFPAGIGMKVTPFYRRGYDALDLVATPKLVNGQTVVNPATGGLQLNPNTATNLGNSFTDGIELYVSKESAYGLSGSLSATYLNEFTNVVPTPLIQEDFFPSIPTASVLLGNLYRVGFLSPLSGSLALSYRFRSGFKINPIFTYEEGYPAGVGNTAAQFVNGKPANVPNTNAEALLGAPTYAPQYVDPQNPGSLYTPNIAATRGTSESSSPASFITNPRFNTNIDLEYSPASSRSTFGVLISNLFNQTYSAVPTYNSRYQPVATGIAGPKTGYSSIPLLFPNEGFQQYLPNQFGQDPYRDLPTSGPQSVQLYYQLKL